MSESSQLLENTNGSPPSSASSEFQPFVSPQNHTKELTLRAILFGLFFAVIFGASSVYLALRAGMTIGGSIPIAVIAVGLLKRWGKTTLLENNIVQTIGSAGESVAGGLVFRIVGLIFLAEGVRYFHYPQVLTLALFGGLLGILVMIPLRKSLIVKEHKTLPYPEGTACAEVLMAGEKEGNAIKPVFVGSLMGAVYWILMKLFGFWNEVPYVIHRAANRVYPNATLTLDVAPEYLGIGYIIGLRSTIQMMVGGVLTWFILIPVFSTWPKLGIWLGGKDVHTMLRDFGGPLGDPQALPTAVQVHAADGKFIAIGAVIFAGLFTLGKTFPLIIASFRSAIVSLREQKIHVTLRTEREIPMWVVILGLALLVIVFPFLPHMPGKFPISVLMSILIVMFGFFFVTVSSRFVGVIGYTNEPTGPMTFTTVMITCLIFLLLKFTSVSDQTLVLIVGAVACTAAGNAGAVSQDLKTGFLLGATPWKQQVGMILGIALSATIMTAIILLIDHSIPQVSHAIGYVTPGDEAPKYAAPSANLLSILIKSFLSGNVPWGLVLVGVVLALVAEVSGLSALSFAAGIYFPISATATMFLGGVVHWLVKHKEKQAGLTTPTTLKESEISPGMLYATGLVAAGSISGMFLGFFEAFFPKQASFFNLGKEYWKSIVPWGDYFAIATFCVLGLLLYRAAMQRPKR